MNYTQHFSTKVTPQSQPIPGTTQVKNNASGYTWSVDDWKRLDRFLVIGAEGGTFYVSEQKLTVENANAVLACIKTDGKRVVERAVMISETGRAPKNDPALFVLAMAAGLGDGQTRKYALEMLPRVARIGTHLFHFNEMVQAFRGWGRGLREANAKWYNAKSADDLAYQLAKYQQRDGWSHRDILRLAHPKPATDMHKALYQWVTRGETELELPRLIQDFARLQSADTDKAAIAVLANNKSLTWEMVPTELLGSAKVWEALLPNMPLTAMIRNLGRMTANGLLKPLSDAASLIVKQITDEVGLKKSRVHPIAILTALMTYQSGHGMRGSLTWSSVTSVVDALDKAFYLSFGNVEPSGKKLLLGLDVSGSMTGRTINNVPGLTPCVAAGAMALVTAATEPNHLMVAFDTSARELTISPRQRLDDVVRMLNQYGGGTNCALPMLYAEKNSLSVDAFVIWTDSETWQGSIHPSQAMRSYREKINQSAKMVTVGMVANHATINDPNDFGMLEVVGFDAAAPQVISDFISE